MTDWDAAFLEWALPALDQQRWFALLTEARCTPRLIVTGPVLIVTIDDGTFATARRVIERLGGQAVRLDPTKTMESTWHTIQNKSFGLVLLWDGWVVNATNQHTIITWAGSVTSAVLCVDIHTRDYHHVEQLSRHLNQTNLVIYYPGCEAGYGSGTRGFWVLIDPDDITLHISEQCDQVYTMDSHTKRWVRARTPHFEYRVNKKDLSWRSLDYREEDQTNRTDQTDSDSDSQDDAKQKIAPGPVQFHTGVLLGKVEGTPTLALQLGLGAAVLDPILHRTGACTGHCTECGEPCAVRNRALRERRIGPGSPRFTGRCRSLSS